MTDINNFITDIDTVEEKKDIHVDDYIWDYSSDPKDNYAKYVLMHFRLPATQKSVWSRFVKDYKLFCDYEGKTFAVIGASRLGDIWLTDNLAGEFPYQKRVMVNQVSNFRDKP